MKNTASTYNSVGNYLEFLHFSPYISHFLVLRNYNSASWLLWHLLSLVPHNQKNLCHVIGWLVSLVPIWHQNVHVTITKQHKANRVQNTCAVYYSVYSTVHAQTFHRCPWWFALDSGCVLSCCHLV